MPLCCMLCSIIYCKTPEVRARTGLAEGAPVKTKTIFVNVFGKLGYFPIFKLKLCHWDLALKCELDLLDRCLAACSF